MRRRYVLTALGAACLAATGCAATAMRESNDRNAASGSPLWTAGYNGMLATANNGGDANARPFKLFGRPKADADLAADQTPRKGLFSWLGNRNQAGPADVAANDRNEANPRAGKREVIPVSDVTAVNPPQGQPAVAAPAQAPGLGGRISNRFARLGAKIRGEQAEIPAATVVEPPAVASATNGGGPIRGMVSRWKERQDRRAAEAAAIASLTGPGRMPPRSSTAPMQGPMMQPGQVPGGSPINQPWGRPMMARSYRDDSPSFRTTGAGSAGEVAASEKVPPLPVAIEVPAPGSEAAGATGSLAANQPGRKFDITPTASRSNQVEAERPKRLVREWRPSTNPIVATPPAPSRIARAENAPIDNEAEPTAAPAPDAAPAMTQPPLPAPSLPPAAPAREPAPAPAPEPEPVAPEPVKPEPVAPIPAPTPEPVAPAPTPEPVAPAPAPTPEPVAPAPAPEPVKPEPVAPEPVKPEPVKPEPVKPAQPEKAPAPKAVEPAPAPALDLGPPPEVKPEPKTPEKPKTPEPKTPEEPKKAKAEAEPKPKAPSPAPAPASAEAPKAGPAPRPAPPLPRPEPPASDFDLPAIGAPRHESSLGSPRISPQLTGPRLPEPPATSLAAGSMP